MRLAAGAAAPGTAVVGAARCSMASVLLPGAAATPRRAGGAPGGGRAQPRAQPLRAVVAQRHAAADGASLEVLHAPAAPGAPPTRPPLLFVHGSYHAAWCWAVHFMPHFAAAGYACYALSMRGQGASDGAGGKLALHAADVAHLAAALPGGPPVIVAHSFGGLVVQDALLRADCPKLAGAAFLCSVRAPELAAPPSCGGGRSSRSAAGLLAGAQRLAPPSPQPRPPSPPPNTHKHTPQVPPSGNSAIVRRYVLRDPLRALRVTYGFISKNFVDDAAAARELFFSADLPAAELERYMAELATCSRARLLDLKDVGQRVPLPHPAAPPPVFVLGGADDAVVDPPAVAELGAAYGVTPVLLEGLAHDVMLDTRWAAAAGALQSWLEALPAAG